MKDLREKMSDATCNKRMDGLVLVVEKVVEEENRGAEDKRLDSTDTESSKQNVNTHSDKLPALSDEGGIIDMDQPPAPAPEPSNVIDVDAASSPPVPEPSNIIDVDAFSLKPAASLTLTDSSDVIEVHVATNFTKDPSIIATPEVLSNVYEYTSAGKEFVSRESDSRTRKQALGKTFIGTMRIGYGEIDLFNLQNWYRELRFFPIVSDAADPDGNIWCFRLVIVNPRASDLPRPANGHYRKRIDGFLPLLKNFYEKAFSPTEATVNSISLAVQHEISFMLVALKCPLSHDVKPFWQEDTRSLKIVAAITFSHCGNSMAIGSVDVYMSWLNVAANAMKPLPPNPLKGWRRQGFGLFLIKCMLKYCYAINKNTKAVDVYLQCYEPQAFNCYSMIGFVKINGKHDDGFDLLPQSLQDSLLSPPAESRIPGKCLFHFRQSKPLEGVVYHLMRLRSGCLRHFQAKPGSAKTLLGDPQQGNEGISWLSCWCQYPPPIVHGKRLEHSKKNMMKLFNGFPLLKSLLPPPYDFTLSSAPQFIQGDMLISNRLLHTQSVGTKWMATAEIDLMISTILWDGRYSHSCFVFPSAHSFSIESAFQLYTSTMAAQKLHDEEIEKGVSPKVVAEDITKKYGFPLFELRHRYCNIRDWLLKSVIYPNSGLLCRRLLIFPTNLGNQHWMVTFVFNPSFIDEQDKETNPRNSLRPCFFRYCSQQPHGRRRVCLSSGITWFLNLCYSVQEHDKRHGVFSSVKFEFMEPFGDSDPDGFLLGTKAFPALHLPEDSYFLPLQDDEYNCGIGACASIAIILRDVVFKATEQHNDGKNEYEEHFCVKSLPLKECPLTQEVYCDMPKGLLDPLPTKQKLNGGDYLTLVREQWFLLFDRLAHLQHVIEPTNLFGNHEVSQVYNDHVEAIAEWPLAMNSSLRRAAKKISRKPKVKLEVDNAPETIGITMKKDNAAAPTNKDVMDKKRGHHLVTLMIEASNEGAMDPQHNNHMEAIDDDEDSSSNKESEVSDVDEGEGASSATKPKVFLNGVYIDMGHADDEVDEGKQIHVTCPAVFIAKRVKRPLKRKPDLVEVHAATLLKKIKAKDPRAASKLEEARVQVQKQQREICTQSKALCEAICAEYGTELPPKTIINSHDYEHEMEQYIENSFIQWKWHSNAAHQKEIQKWLMKLNDNANSEKTRKKICLMIKALRQERSKFRKYFAEEYQCTQKSLVKSIKFVEESNSFVALLRYIEEIPIYFNRNELPRRIERYERVNHLDEIPVDKKWVKEQFGEKMYQHIINMRSDPHHAWVTAPRDVDVFIGKQKVVRVRYAAERTQWIVDTQKLSEEVEAEQKEKNGAQLPIESKPTPELGAVLETKLRPWRKGIQFPLAQPSPAKIARSIDAKMVPQTPTNFAARVMEDTPRKPITIPARWTGKTMDGKNVTLEEDFVRMSFGDAFANELKKCNRGFVDIPVGDFKASHLDQHPNLKVIGGPIVNYVHSKGKDLCITKSLASAFFALGWHEESAKIDNFGEVILGGLVVQALDRVVKYTKTLFPRWVTISMIPRRFDWQTDLRPTDVMVGVLIACDGSCSHAVTIHGNFVFDANETVVLPLCKEALDYCTSTAKVKSTFVGFKKGFIYRYHGFQENKIARMTLK